MAGGARAHEGGAIDELEDSEEDVVYGEVLEERVASAA